MIGDVIEELYVSCFRSALLRTNTIDTNPDAKGEYSCGESFSV